METVELIIKVSQLITAAGIIIGVIFAFVRWLIKQNSQDEEIEAADKRIDEIEQKCNDRIEELRTESEAKMHEFQTEQAVICYGVLAALKGLKEKGCNGPVTEAINKLEKHLNVHAHK